MCPILHCESTSNYYATGMSTTAGNTVCIRDLDKLNLVKLAYGGLVFKLEPIFATAPAASKNDACFKGGEK